MNFWKFVVENVSSFHIQNKFHKKISEIFYKNSRFYSIVMENCKFKNFDFFYKNLSFARKSKKVYKKVNDSTTKLLMT